MVGLETVFQAIGISALILSLLALIIGSVALILIIGFKSSTHKIEWRTLDEADVQTAEEIEKALTDREDDVNFDLF